MKKITLLLSMLLLCACTTENPTGLIEEFQAEPRGFDNRRDTIILYAEIHYPGVPKPTQTPNDRYCPFLPSLRVWGDGFAFLDEKIENNPHSILSGQLKSETVEELLGLLDVAAFFTDWQVLEPNPAGTSLKLGARLAGQPAVEYTTGDLNAELYLQLVGTVRPELKQLSEQEAIDPRVEDLLARNVGCNQY